LPTVAPVGYVNNRITHRIDVDPVRGPLVARVFVLYATGAYSLKTITKKAYEIGLRHPRADRHMTNPKSIACFSASFTRATSSGLANSIELPRVVDHA
jgi:hypothetical protein